MLKSRRSARKSNMSHNPPLIQVDIPHKDKISLFMQEFVVKVTNVVGDGHCVFRTIAGICDMTVDDYHVNL
jgi:hypothetical protein